MTTINICIKQRNRITDISWFKIYIYVFLCFVSVFLAAERTQWQSSCVIVGEGFGVHRTQNTIQSAIGAYDGDFEPHYLSITIIIIKQSATCAKTPNQLNSIRCGVE